MNAIYFDHNATTGLRAEVLEAMLPWMQAQHGNPTSRHMLGRAARDAVEQARTQVAEACGAYPSQVVLTASGTESNNFAIKGMAGHVQHGQLLTSAIEHPCVTRPAQFLAQHGFTHQTIAVDANGKVLLTPLAAQLKKPTSLVSVMLANNETGAIQEVDNIAEMSRAAGALTHTDAVQAFGKIPVNFADLNVHAMTLSSHKIGGPQGAAALVLDKRVDIQPLLHGGGQEKGLRSGTEHVAAIVGFGAACELAAKQLSAYAAHTQSLRDQLELGLRALPNVGLQLFASQGKRLSNTSFFAIEGIEGETLVMALDRKGFAVASGSACSSDSTEPSHVLLAMGIEPDVARGAIRVSLGLHNTAAQVSAFLSTLHQEVLRLKQMMAIAA